MPPLKKTSTLDPGLQCAAEIIRSSKKAVVLTGAGISTPSGIPDFRSPDSGLWADADSMEVASLLSFRYNPNLFYNWMHPLANKIYHAAPNAAHQGLAELEQAGYIKAVITQNIDGLHQRAGSDNVLEVHGSLSTLTCTGCYRQYSTEQFLQPYLLEHVVPMCPVCNRVLKPDLVLFGEQLPARTWKKANQVSKQCDLMIVAGSSLEVLPAAGLPMRALENGAHLIIINHSPTYLDVRADFVFHDDLAEVIPLLVQSVLDRG